MPLLSDRYGKTMHKIFTIQHATMFLTCICVCVCVYVCSFWHIILHSWNGRRNSCPTRLFASINPFHWCAKFSPVLGMHAHRLTGSQETSGSCLKCRSWPPAIQPKASHAQKPWPESYFCCCCCCISLLSHALGSFT